MKLVLIEHTGDPARYPSCERVMHEPAPVVATCEIALPGTPTACGVTLEFCSLDEPREQTGWNWCPACFPGRKPRSFFREYSLVGKAWGMLRSERAEIAQQERLLPPRSRKKEDEKTKLARLIVEGRKIRVDRAALLAERAREAIDQQRVAEIVDSAHPNILANLRLAHELRELGLAAREAEIDEQQAKVSRKARRKPSKPKPKGKKR